MDTGQNDGAGAPAGDVGGEGGAPNGVPAVGDAANWYDGFADPVKEYTKAKGFKDAGSAIEAYMQLETKLGKAAFPEPDMAKLDDWAGWDKLRGGKDPTTYDLKIPDMPEGLEFDRGMLDRVLGNSGKYLPEAVAQKLTDDVSGWLVESFQASVEAQTAKVAALNAGLDKDWGEDRPAREARAQNVFKTLFEGDVEALSALERLVGDHSTVRLMDKLGTLLGEDNIHVDKDGGGGSTQQVQAEINKLRADPEFMSKYNDRKHPERKSAQARMDALYARLPSDDENDD
jgi:hypothetical protein